MSRGPAGLSFDPTAAPAAPVPAATVVVVRDAPGGLELFCVQRHPKSAFLGGAIVFPGGKLDASDRLVVERGQALGCATGADAFGADPVSARALEVAAARETLEEAGIVPTDGAPEVARALRHALRSGVGLPDALEQTGLTLALGQLTAFARWVTPEAEARRFDACFYVLPLPPGQEASHDDHETTMGFWARPAEVLERFSAGDFQLAPPTTRTLELLAPARTTQEVLAVAALQSRLPICPRFVPGDPPALALPGDPAHDVRERRVDGATRFVLRSGRFVSEDAPDPAP